jgi:hypothetical protein
VSSTSGSGVCDLDIRRVHIVDVQTRVPRTVVSEDVKTLKTMPGGFHAAVAVGDCCVLTGDYLSSRSQRLDTSVADLLKHVAMPG